MSLLPAANAIVIPGWPAPPCIRAAVTTRCLPGNSQPPFDAFNLGLRSGEDGQVVQANRDLLVRALALPSAPRWLRQVHGTFVAQVDHALPAGEPQADAAVTRERGIVLAILSADCLPLLLCADDGSEIAAAHAGWRGLAAGVIEACIGGMSTPPSRLLAWLGPAIGQASYEVGDEVRAAFVDRGGGAAAFTASRPGHWFFDLYTLAHERLAGAGIARVCGGGFDTCADARFYSYRRDGGHSGRFASLIHIV